MTSIKIFTLIYWNFLFKTNLIQYSNSQIFTYCLYFFENIITFFCTSLKIYEWKYSGLDWGRRNRIVQNCTVLLLSTFFTSLRWGFQSVKSVNVLICLLTISDFDDSKKAKMQKPKRQNRWSWSESFQVSMVFLDLDNTNKTVLNKIKNNLIIWYNDDKYRKRPWDVDAGPAPERGTAEPDPEVPQHGRIFFPKILIFPL